MIDFSADSLAKAPSIFYLNDVKRLNLHEFGRRFLYALIALALMLAPIQFAQPAKATSLAAIQTSDCMKPPKCCEQGKKDCAQMPGCVANCSALLSPGVFVPFAVLNLTAVEGVAVPVVLKAHATSPPRRPPRI